MFATISFFHILLIYITPIYHFIGDESINYFEVNKLIKDNSYNTINKGSIIVTFSTYLSEFPDNKIKLLVDEIEILVEENVRNHGMGISYFGNISIKTSLKDKKLMIQYRTEEGSDACNEFEKIITDVIDNHYVIKNGNVTCL
uniref:SEA domain-containing protein n=1 Tax=Strongyloides venezuelensis TaxID=75913 RepID=A0A0K0EWI5_STRVS